MTNAASSCHRRVCLFGTSANPPTGTGGHVGIVQALSGLRLFDEIRVLPVYQHTFSAKRNQLISYDQRVEMCQLAFQNIPNAVVSRAEQRSWQHQAQHATDLQALRVGTADLLEMLQSESPHDEFTFCLGADTFMDLTAWKWKRSRDVLRLLQGRLVVFLRPSAGEGALSDKERIRNRIADVNKEMGYSHDPIILLEVPTLEAISSSMVRSAGSVEEIKQIVTPEVLDYIVSNDMYGFMGRN